MFLICVRFLASAPVKSGVRDFSTIFMFYMTIHCEVLSVFMFLLNAKFVVWHGPTYAYESQICLPN